MPEETLFTIAQLSEAASVTPRTIRYYLGEGLLPAPLSQGRYAGYTQAHLQRLRLIQRLKNAFLPLAAIKAQLEGLSDADVETLLAENSRVPAASDPKVFVRAAEPHVGRSDLAYIAQILAVTGQSAWEPDGDAPTGRPRRALLVSPALRPTAAPEEREDRKEAAAPKVEAPRAASLSVPPTARDVWERIPLAGGAELHVRAPAAPEARERLERLIAATKALFDESGQPG